MKKPMKKPIPPWLPGIAFGIFLFVYRLREDEKEKEELEEENERLRRMNSLIEEYRQKAILERDSYYDILEKYDLEDEIS